MQSTRSYGQAMQPLNNLVTRRSKCALYALLGLLALGGAACAADPEQSSDSRAFVIFDGLLFKPMPDLRATQGMPKLLGLGNVWRAGVSKDTVDSESVAKTASFLRSYSDTYYLDIENWLHDGESDAAINADVAKFIQVAELARKAAPGGQFGFYGVVPLRTYWPIVLNRADALQAWHHMNELSAPIAAHTDYVLPSLYTFYEDPAGWEKAARAVLEEAHRYGKPVYPFLWFEYHNSSATLAGKQVPPEAWRRELEICYQYADGVVLWGGFGKKWDEQAPWWQETLAFMRAHSNKQPRSPEDVHLRR
jgi:hypothetical protein